MDSSPHLNSRSSRTASPQIQDNDRDSTIIIGTSADDEEMHYSPIRKAPPNTTAKDSFGSYSTRPPPASPTETTPLTAFEKHDTLPVLQDHTPIKPHAQTMLAPQTPPKSAQRTGSATATAGPSPSRALSLPMTPAHRPALTDGSDDSLVAPHRATSAMAKRSAADGSARKVAPLPSSTSAVPTTSKGRKIKRATRNEDEYGADDEGVPSKDSSQVNPLVATQSMPDLRESPQRHLPIISFLPKIIENEKKAIKVPPPVVEASPGRSTADTEEVSSSSLSSQKFSFYSRYAQQKATPTVRPLTQRPIGENPPGITVHSQSQSDHNYSHSSGDYHAPDHRDFTASLERRGTTLVAGTPSETSESSQPERDLDMSQLYREGRSFMPDPTQEEMIPTQVIGGTQDVETQAIDNEYAVTQSVHEHAETLLFRVPGSADTMELAAQAVVETLDVSPRKAKPKGFYSSSSGTSNSIPGLSHPDSSGVSDRDSKPQNNSPAKNLPKPGMIYTPSKPAPIPVYRAAITSSEIARSSTPTRVNRPNTLQTSRPPNNNIPLDVAPITAPRPFGTLATSDKALKKPAATLKRSTGLMRRKEPAPAVDQWLAEREAQMRAEAEAAALAPQEEETLPVDHPADPCVPQEEETQSLGLYPLWNLKLDERDLGGLHEKTQVIMDNTARLEDHQSLVMDTDEEPLGESQISPVLVDSRWRSSPKKETPADRTPKPNNNMPKLKAFLISGLIRDRSESIEEPVPPRAASTSAKGSNTTTVAVNSPVEWKNDDEDEESSVDDDASDYRPQETQTQADVLEEEAIVEGEADDDEDDEGALFLPTVSRAGSKNKRNARSQGGRNFKRICRRTDSPEVLPVTPTPKASLKARRAGAVVAAPPKDDARKPMLPLLDTAIKAPPMRATRATQNRARTGSKAMIPPRVGHLVLVRYIEARKFFLGYAVARTGKSWEITPSDGSPTIYSELKNMREGVFHVGDFVSVSANSGGENCGDAIVIAVDEQWDEDRNVKVRIGGKEADLEERYVAIRHLSVEERHIKQWSDRKISHKDLESDDGMETMSAPTSAALNRRESFTIPTPARHFASSTMRIPQTSSGKLFSGVGFILTNCDNATLKRITDYGGYIYPSWLNAFKFDGAFENIKGVKGQQRWIRRLPGVGPIKGKARGAEISPVMWVGNEDEQRVKIMFLVAGKVAMTAKTLISLALGVPCVSNKWIEACESEGTRVDWIPYLLPSHNMPSPLSLFANTLPSQAPDFQWGSEANGESLVLDNILTHGPLAHRRLLTNSPRILYIAEECIRKLALDYDEHVDVPTCQVPFVYCCLAMGAQHVEAVEQYSYATDRSLSKYDVIVVADTLMDAVEEGNKLHKDLITALMAAEESGIKVLNQSDFKMSVACGKLLKLPRA